MGADGGLELSIEWAKKYNKKLMMTEIGSWDAEDGTGPACRAKMTNYLQRMNESGVFIGYQVWQFGCPHCTADLWTERPLNFYWYRLSEFGAEPGLGTSTSTTATTTIEETTSSTTLSSTTVAKSTTRFLNSATTTVSQT